MRGAVVLAVVLKRQAGIFFVALALASGCLVAASSLALGKPAGDAPEQAALAAPHAAEELVVTYEDGASRTASSPIEEEDARVAEELSEVGAEVVEFAAVKEEGEPEARKVRLAGLKKKLEEDPNVASVDYNYARAISYSPNDPGLGDQWALDRAGFGRAWSGERGSGAKIAILDTGISAGHPDLTGKVSAQRDFVEDDNVANDSNGHGTAVAGIAAARADNGAGVAGACPDCRLVVAKVMGGDGIGYDSDIAQAITWSVNNDADVINLSLGGRADSTILKEAVDYAAKKGVVAAAGNRGVSSREYPAAYPSVISVISTDRGDARASDSNFGSWVDVAAPGVGILSTVPGGYGYWSGTSMAVPHVAAYAGLLSASGAGNVEDRILKTAKDLGSNGTDPYYGAGRIDASGLAGGDRPSGRSDAAPKKTVQASFSNDGRPPKEARRTKPQPTGDSGRKNESDTATSDTNAKAPADQEVADAATNDAVTPAEKKPRAGEGSGSGSGSGSGRDPRQVTELPDTGGPSLVPIAGLALFLIGATAFHASRPRPAKVRSRRD